MRITHVPKVKQVLNTGLVLLLILLTSVVTVQPVLYVFLNTTLSLVELDKCKPEVLSKSRFSEEHSPQHLVF